MKRILSIFLVLCMMSGCSNNSSMNKNSDRINTTSNSTSEQRVTETMGINQATTNSLSCSSTTTSLTTTTFLPEPTDAPNDGQLVRILDYIPDAYIDLRYATTNNFTGTILYDYSEAYICYGTVKKLCKVQEELKEKGFSILIWDAYRTPEAQQKLWDTYPDPTFVANPRNGLTSHNRGNTLDISIVCLDGSSVEMPSKFDEFSSIADRNYNDVSELAAQNAILLESIMYNNGFTGYVGEWWDYSDTEVYNLEMTFFLK